MAVDQVNKKTHPALSQVIMKALAKLPEERYQSGQDLVNDLEKCKASSGESGGSEAGGGSGAEGGSGGARRRWPRKRLRQWRRRRLRRARIGLGRRGIRRRRRIWILVRSLLLRV